MAQLRQEDLRALEQSRQRLYQLTQSIGSLKNDILRTSPLPQWDSIQISAQILGQNLKSITEHLSTHSELLEKTVIYPSTNFPGRTQENLLGQLLRKKLEPDVETWIEEAKALNEGGAGDDDIEDLWNFAKESIIPAVVEAARTIRRENYTAEEKQMGIENVVTGLKVPPKLRQPQDDDESGSEEDEEEDEVMEDVAVPARAPKVPGRIAGSSSNRDQIFRFMATGLEPEDDPLQPQLQAEALKR